MLKFNETPMWGMGTSFDKYPDQALVGWAENTCFWVFFWCLVLWILLPSSCVCVPQLQTDRRELSKHTFQVSQAYPVCVSKVGFTKKGKALFLKDFQTFGILSFEKSVEEMILRPKAFSFGNLDLLSDLPWRWRRGPKKKGAFRGD